MERTRDKTGGVVTFRTTTSTQKQGPQKDLPLIDLNIRLGKGDLLRQNGIHFQVFDLIPLVSGLSEPSTEERELQSQ